jgi:hypothetical protein
MATEQVSDGEESLLQGNMNLPHVMPYLELAPILLNDPTTENRHTFSNRECRRVSTVQVL